MQGRSKEEERKLARLKTERGVPVLWTTVWTTYVVITGLAVVALIVCAVLAVNTRGQLAGYDPYAVSTRRGVRGVHALSHESFNRPLRAQILGILAGSSDKEVKSAYRKLSMLHHPDKGGDAATFQKIAKAYEALMDPVARENLAKFGNPDGKQTLEVAIGIPSALVGATGRYVFMAGYLLVLAGGIPAAMQYFWRQGQKNKDIGDFDLLRASNEWLVMTLRERPDLTVKAVPELLAGMKEVEAPPAGKGVLGQAEKEETEGLQRELMGGTNLERWRMAKPSNWTRSMIQPSSIFINNLVLHAFLNRKTLTSPVLIALLRVMLAHAHKAIEFMWVVAFQLTLQAQGEKDKLAGEGKRGQAQSIRSWTEAMASLPTAAAQVTQAVYGRDSDLLQIVNSELVPSISEAIRVARGMKPSAQVGLADLLAVPRGEWAAVLSNVVGLPPADVAALSRQLDEYPRLNVTTSYEVKEEEGLAEGDIVTLTVTLKHENILSRPGCTASSPVPLVMAPRFPTVRPETWVVYLCDSRSRLMAAIPSAFEPKKAVEQLTLQFMAPRAGKLDVTLYVQSMSYVGLDVVVPAT